MYMWVIGIKWVENVRLKDVEKMCDLEGNETGIRITVFW
jgi:hypothetical protein